MTSKKQRQRGSRTHGGGTHKNRRGAGNRGGRGRAGRSKHHEQIYGPLGKHGFTRPPDLQSSVAEVDLQWLDEEITLLAADGLAESTDEGYRVDARAVADQSADIDVVKVLGNANLRNTLIVTADDFSETAIERIEESGGQAITTDEVAANDNEE